MKKPIYVILFLITIFLLSGCISKNKSDLNKSEKKNSNNEIRYYECSQNKKDDPYTFVISSLTINYSAVDSGETNHEKYQRILKKHNLNNCWEKKKKS